MVVEVEQAAASKSAAAARNKSMKVKSKAKPPPPPSEKKTTTKKKKQQTTEAPPESPSYRLALRSLFSCRNSHAAPDSKKLAGCSSAPSICKHKDIISEQTKPAAAAPTNEAKRRASVSGSSERCVKKPLSEVVSTASNNNTNSSKLLLMQRGGGSSSSSSSTGGGASFRRRLSGCYECHMVVDPIFRDSSSMRAAAMICPCPDCGEIFVRQESLQLHQSIRHAVCELGSDDTSRNIIEIIFQSSWLKKQSPVCRIERILKVHNTPRTLARFEEYREAVKDKAKEQLQRKKNYPRCTADGNELLRFHCAALACSLGLNGATHLCGAATCATCAIIRDGFSKVVHNSNDGGGIRTMATSGRAHDDAAASSAAESKGDDQTSSSSSSRAMLVCRVIAGRVKRPSSNSNHHDEEEEEVHEQEAEEEGEEYESVAGSAGVYSNMEELLVFNPRAILPCFVVIYNAA